MGDVVRWGCADFWWKNVRGKVGRFLVQKCVGLTPCTSSGPTPRGPWPTIGQPSHTKGFGVLAYLSDRQVIRPGQGGQGLAWSREWESFSPWGCMAHTAPHKLSHPLLISGSSTATAPTAPAARLVGEAYRQDCRSQPAPRRMRFQTVKAVRLELHRQGGWLETIRDTERPEYAPHLNWKERGWPQGLWIKDELLDWANAHL